MKRLVQTIAIVLFCNTLLYGQQDPQFSQYMLNKLYYNPAYAGVDPDWMEVAVIHRTQWLGYQPTFDDGGSLNTQVISLNMPFTKYNFGIGLHLANDKQGNNTTTEGQLSLAYHIKIKKDKVLSFGLRTGLYNLSIDFDKYRFVDPDDRYNIGGKQSEIVNDFAAGIYFKSTKYYAGLSVNHLQQSEIKTELVDKTFELVHHLTIMGGADFEVSRVLTLSPSAVLKTDFDVFYSFEGSLIATYDNKYYGGVSLRETEAAILLLGVHLMKDNRLRIGYAFDYTLQGREAKSATSHELLLTYKMPAFKFFERPIIRTPRFRHE
ncbi:type IX secretion system membrane protein PorP/SprF [Rapidithrix thailandica]|uniref:Type IX secretion system membrane protein PorP/SprF n=1 Tax=Rapidithrix thailandica TaxID=413964 RepID=A0AAW9RPT7_9BACT